MKKKVVLLDIDYTLFDTDTFKQSSLKDYLLYEEVIPVLERLSKRVELGIFSKGDIDFQHGKLQKTGLRKFFKSKNIHIFLEKEVNLENVLGKYKDFEIFLVDDRLKTLETAKNIMPSIFTIWVKRGPYAESERFLDNFSPDAIVNDFSSLDKIISEN